MLHGPQPDVQAVEAIALLYASRADSEAHARHEEVTAGMSAREALKFSPAVEDWPSRKNMTANRTANAGFTIPNDVGVRPTTVRVLGGIVISRYLSLAFVAAKRVSFD